MAPGSSSSNVENSLLPELQQARGASRQISTYDATLLRISPVVLRNNNLMNWILICHIQWWETFGFHANNEHLCVKLGSSIFQTHKSNRLDHNMVCKSLRNITDLIRLREREVEQCHIRPEYCYIYNIILLLFLQWEIGFAVPTG